VGKWNFFATPPIKKSLAELYKLSCGHQIPSRKSSSYKFNMKHNEFSENFTIELNDSDEATYFHDKTTKEDIVYKINLRKVFGQ
jgi:hypothetical protein